jgi:hypothetical protein
MNIAIIIGVSVYGNSRNNLPGCRNDADAMNQILKRTGKYDQILYINSNENSAKTKELLSNFFLDSKNNVIEELFFYYSGHGEFHNDEFYYVLSDFDQKKKNQTSLQNTEVDELIRTLSPELVIKFVDACQSGTTYIKEGDVLAKHFTDTKKRFNKCYFLNSSLNNQSSFQTQHLSFFTFSFIKALKEHQTKEIRYKDIIDVISDEFSENQGQTPFFIIQADLTEKFCSFSNDLKEYLDAFNPMIEINEDSKSAPLTLVDFVKKDAKEYVDNKGALNAIDFVRREFQSFTLSPELKDLYKFEIDFLQEYRFISNSKAIGRWLRDNKNDYFAKPMYEMRMDPETGEEYRLIVGFDLTFETPFKAILMDVNSLYPNLTSYQCCIVFLVSKKLLTFFYFITNYIDEGWENRTLNIAGLKWLYIETRIADENAIKAGIESIKTKVEGSIKEELSSKFEAPGPVDDLPF